MATQDPVAIATAHARRAWMKRFMADRGLTIPALGKLTGVPLPTLYSYLNGDTLSMHTATVDALCRGLDTSRTLLFGDEDLGMVLVIGRIVSAEGWADRYGEPVRHVPLPPGCLPDQGLVAFEVEDFEQGLIERGCTLIFRELSVADGDWAIGKIVLAETREGRCGLRRLGAGPKPGYWELEALDRASSVNHVQLARLWVLVSVGMPPDLGDFPWLSRGA